jgi:hypothetical protein
MLSDSRPECEIDIQVGRWTGSVWMIAERRNQEHRSGAVTLFWRRRPARIRWGLHQTFYDPHIVSLVRLPYRQCALQQVDSNRDPNEV